MAMYWQLAAIFIIIVMTAIGLALDLRAEAKRPVRVLHGFGRKPAEPLRRRQLRSIGF